MNATDTGALLRIAAIAVGAAFVWLPGSFPAAAQDRIPPRIKVTGKPQPTSKSLTAIKQQASAAKSQATAKRPAPPAQPAPSLGLPFEDPLRKLGILSGYYDFDRGVEDKVSGMRKPNEVAFANRAYLQSEYHRNQDLDRESTFVGLWTSVPIHSPVSPKSTPKPKAKPKP